MELLRGHVHLPLAQQPIDDDSRIAKTAYRPQEPWIMNQTIRAHILLELRFQNHRYKIPHDAVTLSRDIAEFEDGNLAHCGGTR